MAASDLESAIFETDLVLLIKFFLSLSLKQPMQKNLCFVGSYFLLPNSSWKESSLL